MEVRLCKREKALADLGRRDAPAHGGNCRSVLTLSDVNALRTSHHTLWIPVILDNKALTATRDSMLDSMLDSTLDSRRPCDPMCVHAAIPVVQSRPTAPATTLLKCTGVKRRLILSAGIQMAMVMSRFEAYRSFISLVVSTIQSSIEYSDC